MGGRLGLDGRLALLVVLASVVLMAYTLLSNGSPLFMLVGILNLIFCSFWLWYKKRLGLRELLDGAPGSRRGGLLLIALFFFLVALSILAFRFRPDTYQRPTVFFVLVSLMVGVVSVEALSFRGRWVPVALFQTIVIGVIVSWSQISTTPSLFELDPWYHMAIVQSIVDNGSIPEGLIYSQLPVLHLLIGSTYLVTGLDYKTAAMASAGLAQIVGNALFVYLLGTFITKRPAVGILASLFVTVADYSILMSVTSIPSSLAAVFVPMILYVLFAVRLKAPVKAVLISALLMLTLVLTHTVATVWFALVLLVGAIVFLFSYRRDAVRTVTVPPTLFAFFLVITLAWWGYASSQLDFLSALLRGGFFSEYYAPTLSVVQIPLSEYLLGSLGTYLFFTLALVGVFYMISSRSDRYASTIAWSGLVPLLVGLLSIVLHVFVNQQRWFYYAEIALAIPLAVALLIIVGMPKRATVRSVAAAAMAIPLAFVLIASPVASMDNHVLAPTTSVSLSFTASELAGLNAAQSIGGGRMFGVDALTESPLEWRGYPVVSLDQGFYDQDFTAYKGTVLIIRDDVAEHRPFSVEEGLYKLDYPIEMVLAGEGFSKIYDDGGVRLFYATH
jgi:hypothetical protein